MWQSTAIRPASRSNKHIILILLLLLQIGFARSLGVYDGMLVTSLGQQGSMLEAQYTIPENICIAGGTVGGGGGAFLPCGVTTALFDEVRAAGEVCCTHHWASSSVGPAFSGRLHRSGNSIERRWTH